MLSGLAVAAVTVLAFALLVVVHEAGHFAVARLCGMRVERFSVGFGPVLWSRRRGETEWALSALPLGGYVRVAGMAPGERVDPSDRSAYANQPAWRRFLVILAGPATSYLSAVVLAVGLIATLGLREPSPSPVAGEVLAGSPAAQAGLEPGDRVVALDGRPVETWSDLVALVKAAPGRTVTLAVRRGEGPPLELRATPEDVSGQGRLGVAPVWVAVRTSLGDAVVQGVRRTNAKAGEILSGLAQVVAGRRAGELRGPVGIAQEMARSARSGAASFLMMVWFISIVLALFNLLPIPALDGGRLVFLLYEIVTRRPVNQRVEAVVHLAGFLVLFGLLVAVTIFGDLARLLRP